MIYEDVFFTTVYSPITDHILWDIITNGDQATTDPASSSVPKTSLAANARRKMRKLSTNAFCKSRLVIFLSFHDAQMQKTLWTAIKASLEAMKPQRNDGKRILETTIRDFSIGSREPISQEGYTQAISSKVPTAPTVLSIDEIICSFFAQQAFMPTTHDDEDLLQIDEDAMEEIDIRWQVAMIIARIRKFMRKKETHWTSTKNGITFDNKQANGRNVEQDDWSIEFDAEHMHFGQDGLDDFGTGANQSDDALIEYDLKSRDLKLEDQTKGTSSSLMKEMISKRRSPGLAIIGQWIALSMTGRQGQLSDFKEFKGGYVAFGNDSKGGRISGKGTIKTSCLDFEKVSYVEELKFNLLSVSQICDKKHNVLFTDKECLILSPKFKFVDEDLVILRAPRKNDVYSLDLKNIIPSGGITCLVAKVNR
ncbi:hypothetical protein Tco_0277324 [Tanacetum coccineum]